MHDETRPPSESTSQIRAVKLRDYQQIAVEALRSSYSSGHRAPLLVMPVGAGKTVVFAAISASARAKGKLVLVIAHRRELITQAAVKLTDAGVESGIICAGFAPSLDRSVQVGSIQTLIRRLDRLPKFHLIVLDEAHHSTSETWSALIGSQPQARILGVTATPLRLDGKGLGIEDGGPFDDIIVGATVKELVKDGYLSRSRLFIAAREADLRGVHTRAGDYVPGELARAMSEAKITADAVQLCRSSPYHRVLCHGRACDGSRCSIP
jgi:DNA repair protein RadD